MSNTSLQSGTADTDRSTATDPKRDAVANTLDRAGAKLHSAADTLPGGQRVAELAHGAADKLEASGQYLHDHGAKEMMADVEKLVREHPGKSLLAVAVIGVLVGRAFRNG